MARSILYQILTEPVLPPAQQIETVTESRWHQPLANPVLRKGLTVAAIAAAGAVMPAFVPAPPTEWIAPLSQPVYAKRGYATQYQDELFLVGSDTAKDARWFAPLSLPTPRKSQVQPDALAWSYTATAAVETVTVDKWFAPLAVPSRPRVLPTSGHLSLAFTATPVLGSGDVLFASTNNIVPYAKTLLYPALQEPVALSTAETITVDKWNAALSEPVRRRGYPTQQQDELSFVGTDLGADVRWLAPLSEPVRRRGYQTYTQDELFFVGSDVARDARWFAPLSDPVRRRGYPAYIQDELFLVGSDSARDARWFASLSEPVRRKPAAQPDAQSWSYYTPVSAEIVTIDKWFAELQQPVRRFIVQYPQLAFAALPVSGNGNVLFAFTNNIVPYAKSLLYPALQEPVALATTETAEQGGPWPYSQIPLYRSKKKKKLLEELAELIERLNALGYEIPKSAEAAPYVAAVYPRPLAAGLFEPTRTRTTNISRAQANAEFQKLIKKLRDDDDDDAAMLLLY